jgi:hypothetical protein
MNIGDYCPESISLCVQYDILRGTIFNNIRSKDSPFLIVPSVFSKVYSFRTFKIKKLESLKKSQSFGVCKQSYFVFCRCEPLLCNRFKIFVIKFSLKTKQMSNTDPT